MENSGLERGHLEIEINHVDLPPDDASTVDATTVDATTVDATVDATTVDATTTTSNSSPIDTVTSDEGHPPNYDTLSLRNELDSEELDNLPPLEYDVVMGTSSGLRSLDLETSVQLNDSIISEAPPSYRQIFGKKDDDGSLSIRKWRRSQRSHTRSRRNADNRNTRSSSSSDQNETILGRINHIPKMSLRLIIICVSLTALSLPFSMLAIGSANLNICSRVDVPLYLIVAGFFLSLEIIIHTSTILMTQCTDNESTIRSLRLCDCFAFFILIWILVGSNWVFKVSLHSSSNACTEPTNTGTDGKYGFGNGTDVFTEASCMDCSVVVYKFTSGVIIIQYIIAFFILVTCCSSAIRNKST